MKNRFEMDSKTLMNRRLRKAAECFALALDILIIRQSIRTINWEWDPRVEEMIMVENTTWNAEIRSDACSFPLLCTRIYGFDIRLVHHLSGTVVELVEGADVLYDKIESTEPNVLTITLSNMTVATLHENAATPGVRVIWNFTPVNDPIARELHRRWVRGEWRDTAVKDWYCSTQFTKLSLSERERADEHLAYGFFRQHGMHYCLN